MSGKWQACMTLVSYIGMNVCGTVYENGCVVDGMCAIIMAGDRVLLLLKQQY